MFRERPLTWLFLIATACVDLVMVVPMFRSPSIYSGDLPRLVFHFGIPAQLSLVAIWGATGKSQRLTRGAVITLTLFLAILVGRLFPFSWRDLLTFYLVHTLIVCCGTLILRLLGWLRRWPSLVDRKNEKFRYSVIEMFGWTTVVAIWAFAWHHATADDDFYGLFLANLTGIPLVTIVLVCRSNRWRYLALWMLVVYAIAILSVWFTTGRFDSDAGFVLLWGNLTQVTYLGIWYAVERLDLSMRSHQANVEKNSRTSLKLHQE